MRLSTYHRGKRDRVAFVRRQQLGPNSALGPYLRGFPLYLELPRTCDTVELYLPCVSRPEDIFIGVAATLLPAYVRTRLPRCTLIEGPLDRPGRLGSAPQQLPT